MTNIKTEERGLVRDLYSKAILVEDNAALISHRKSKEAMRKVLRAGTRMDALEKEIAELRSLILKMQDEINTSRTST